MRNNNDKLSEREIREAYEDLVFKRVMSLYIESEYEKIETEKETNAEPVEKLIKKHRRKEKLKEAAKNLKKFGVAAAVTFTVLLVSAITTTVAIADVRTAVADAIYCLVYENNERYTKVEIDSSDKINTEIYDWEGAYAPTYIPDGFEFESREDMFYEKNIIYSKNNEIIKFCQVLKKSLREVDTENADVVKTIQINESEGIYIHKKELSCVCWTIDDTLLYLEGTVDQDVLIDIAEGIQKVG